jgi:tyrosyl-DNA phosphodiesterase 2
MRMLASVLREEGYGRGIVAGDFNAISPEDDRLVSENGLEDQWVALHGEKNSGELTWGTGVQLRDGLRPGRLDKVVMMGLEATEMEVLRPGTTAVPRPGDDDDEIPWSDHSGLTCTFNV